MWGWSGFVVHCRKVRGEITWGESGLTAITRQLKILNKHHLAASSAYLLGASLDYALDCIKILCGNEAPHVEFLRLREYFRHSSAALSLSHLPHVHHTQALVRNWNL